MSIEKCCSKCKCTKSLDEFYRERKGYRSQCKKCLNRSNTERYHKDPSKYKTYSERWRKSNQERVNLKSREWAKNNSSSVKQSQKRWRENNRARKSYYNLNRNKRIKEVFDEPIDIQVLLDRDSSVCYLCHNLIDSTLRYPDLMSVSVDHKIPLSKGGRHNYENTAATHLSCNFRKKDKCFNEW